MNQSAAVIARASRVCARPAVVSRAFGSAASSSDEERWKIPTPGPASEISEAQKWKYIALGGFVVVGAAMASIMSGDHEHHGDHGPLPPYRNVRNKPFPWKSDCGLFDFQCQKAWSAAQGK
eukprot:c462_g1_i1.p1 GENE.c462_g1_i1~~c462_g1_i1.p1  ORF type:complete len:133 (+),score=19.01 c462_g1_i1:38-400(+)